MNNIADAQTAAAISEVRQLRAQLAKVEELLERGRSVAWTDERRACGNLIDAAYAADEVASTAERVAWRARRAASRLEGAASFPVLAPHRAEEPDGL